MPALAPARSLSPTSAEPRAAGARQPGGVLFPAAGGDRVSPGGGGLILYLSFLPYQFLHGALWQPVTYSFIHLGHGRRRRAQRDS